MAPAFLRAQANLALRNVTYLPGATRTVRATQTITATPGVTSPAGAVVTFRAGAKITLGPGFAARGGTYFHAEIGAVASYTITVINGATVFDGVATNGGGPGWTQETSVGLQADAAPSGQHFAGWTLVAAPSGCSLANAAASTTNLVMGAGDVTVRADYAVNASSATHAPVAQNITVNPSTDANRNGPITFTGTAQDEDGDLSEVTFHITGPSGTIDLTRNITPTGYAMVPEVWTPASALPAGTYTVQLTARDLTGLSSAGGPSTSFTVSAVAADPELPDDGEPQLKVHRPW